MIEDVREIRLPVSFFSENRQKLFGCLPDKVLVVLYAGRATVMSSDTEYPFFANRNFFYFSGIEQEESILLLYRDGKSIREALFVQTQDPLKERWTGKRLTHDEVVTASGIQEVHFLPTFEDYMKPYLADRNLPVALEEGMRSGPAKDFEKLIRSLDDEREMISLETICARIRMVKEPCELDMIREAIRLTYEATQEACARIRPGVTELDLTSAFDYALARRGCRVSAFPPIFAAAKNALCLHHMNPIGIANAGDLIQMDVGGRVAGLCADISRVFPASGRFDERQLALYAAVRALQEAAFRAIRPGVLLAEINEATKKVAREQLIQLGLLETGTDTHKDVTNYYWHNVSHHMGHDVHDVCLRDLPLEAGMVITVEPGLYVEEWMTGFRIEDDVVVTQTGCELLSDFFPREAHEMCAMTGYAEGGE